MLSLVPSPSSTLEFVETLPVNEEFPSTLRSPLRFACANQPVFQRLDELPRLYVLFTNAATFVFTTP